MKYAKFVFSFQNQITMACALCKQNEGDKKNTHYLTDGIIRTCLNLDGSKKREHGFYFSIDNASPFIEPNFQRKTPVGDLEESYGRSLTEDEIENAIKFTPFSVNDVFCPQCENKFTEIETAFQEQILPLFRDQDLSAIDSLNITNNRLFRLFFLLQIWRSHVCDSNFNLPDHIAEELRVIFNNPAACLNNDLIKYSLSISHLETTGGSKEYTTNMVGSVSGGNPYIIFMNDFVIQFYDNENYNFDSFYGLNKQIDYTNFINKDEQSFNVKVIHNTERIALLNSIETDHAQKVEKWLEKIILKRWYVAFNIAPPLKIVSEFKQHLSQGRFNATKHSGKTILRKIDEFMYYHVSECKRIIKRISQY